MNTEAHSQNGGHSFLNGVCRHEPAINAPAPIPAFLNGVCRHEHKAISITQHQFFLNGVCRHEL